MVDMKKLIHLTLLATLLNSSNCQNDFYLIQKDNETFCFTNSTYALTWISKEKSTMRLRSTFSPNLEDQNINWDLITYKTHTKQFFSNNWTIKKDLSNNLILDRRWEELEILETSDYFNKVLSDLPGNFIIPFSLLIEKNAHIFLCDEAIDTCYMFRICAFERQKTSLIKCRNITKLYTIAHCETRLYDFFNCTKNLNPVPYDPLTKVYLNSNRWLHFELEKHYNNVTLRKIEGTYPKNIIKYDKIDVNINNMIIYSGNVTGFWKIHRLEYAYTNKEIKQENFGPKIEVINGFACYSMFLSMCPLCKIKLTLRNATGVIAEEEYQQPEKIWQEVTIRADGLSRTEVSLLISTISDSEERFWAIDSLRRCHKNEFRMIKSEKEDTCQLVSLEENILNKNGTFNEIQCRNNTLTELCIPCEWFFDQSDGTVKIWGKSNTCLCPKGRIGLDCSSICREGYYGKYCTHKCGHCQGTCDPVYGFCESCKPNYGGIKCDQISCPQITEENMFLKPSNTSLKILFNRKGGTNFCNLKEVLVEFKGKNKTCVFNSICLKDLSPFTLYNITLRNKKEEMLKSFKTTEGIPGTIRNLIFSQESHSVTLTWKNPEKIFGPLTNYTVEYQQLSHLACQSGGVFTKHEINTTKLGLTIELKPFSNYSFSVLASNTCFRGAPIKKFYVTKSSDVIQDQEVPYIANVKKNPTQISFDLSSVDCTKVQGLLTMRASIICLNDWCKNHTKTDFRCYDEKMNLLGGKYYNFNKTQKCLVKDLLPFTNYTLILIFSRSYTSTDRNARFQTEPAVPHPVQELKISKKYLTTVDLQWKPPYPPTGEIYLYNVKYFYDENYKQVNVTEPKVTLQLENQKNYTIMVQALNKMPFEYGTSSIIVIEIRIDPPKPPYNITGKWTCENDLELNWQYQNNSTEEIEFRINLYHQLDNELIYEFNMTDRNQTNYHKSIHPTNILSSNTYNIKIKAYNGIYFSKEVNLVVEPQIVSDCKTSTSIKKAENESLYSTVTIIVITAVSTFVVTVITWRVVVFIKKRVSSGISSLNLIQIIFLSHTYSFSKTNNIFSANVIQNEQQLMPLTDCDVYEPRNKVDVVECTRPVDVANFKDYLYEMLENGELIEQHKVLLCSSPKECKTVEEINSFSFVWTKIRGYFVTEMPRMNQQSLQDFWKLIWEKNIQNVVFLDNENDGKRQKFIKKCWPDASDQLNFDGFLVEAKPSESLNDECKKFRLSYSGNTREIRRYYFSSWVENDLPNTTANLGRFFRLISKISITTNSPVLIMSGCSIEGAGFAALCDISIRHTKKYGKVDIFKTAHDFASCNINLVANFKYYILAHFIILENLIFSSICKNYKSNKLETNDKEISQHWKHLKCALELDQKLKTTKRELDGDIHNYTYIDALNIVTAGKFLVIQQPTGHIISQFWKFVLDENIKTIILLNFPSSEIFSSCGDENTTPVSENISMSYIVKTFKNYDWTTVALEHQKKKHRVEVFSMKDWSSECACPKDAHDFVKFYIESNKILKHCSPVIVTCCDGRQASGLYLSFAYNMEKLETEGICDVCTSVRIVKSAHQEFVKDEVQFQFLYEATDIYLQEIKLYERI